MSDPQRVLCVIGDQSLAARTEELLRRRSLKVSQASSGAGALVLAGNITYDVIVIEAPLPDLAVPDFVSELRGLDSACSNTGVLILASDCGSCGLLEDGDASVRVLAPDVKPVRVQRALSDLLGVASRRSSRLLVRIQVQVAEIGGRPTVRLYQSQNISASGILLRGGQRMEVGREIAFEISLPGERRPISGRASVARHTTPSEPTEGVALRFVDLTPSQQARLDDFVTTGTAEEEAPEAVASAS